MVSALLSLWPVTLFILLGNSAAFAPQLATKISTTSLFSEDDSSEITTGDCPSTLHAESSRRSVLSSIFAVSSSLALIGNVHPAMASGGATAGGAYLLSAKQRYNDRVVKGLTVFLSLGSSLEAKSLTEASGFFSGEEPGSWKDSSAAGYLLANAFRTSSTKPPDSLPAVQKWKAFAAEVKNLEKSVDKKKAGPALDSWKKAKAALSAYLTEVQLTDAIDL